MFKMYHKIVYEVFKCLMSRLYWSWSLPSHSLILRLHFQSPSVVTTTEERGLLLLNTLHNGHALRRARSFYDKLIDMAWAWGWAQVWIVYKHCACTLVRSYTPKYQVMRVGKNAWAQVWIVYNHCACTLVRSRAHHSTRHQIRGGGNTHPPPLWPGPGSHRHPWPGSDLWRPGVTDTGHSPSSPATLPYSVSPLAPQQSSKYCKILGDKDKTTGSFTINILKILAYCCTI